MKCVDARPYAFYRRQFFLGLLLAVSVLGISTCSDSGGSGTTVPVVDPNDAIPPASEDSIAENLLNRPDYQNLLRLIEESDLTETLQGDNSGMGWTLFAPSDTAFENAGLQSLSVEQASALVRNHLFSGQLSVADIPPGELQMTLGRVEVVLNQDGSVTVGGAIIVAGDRVMSNGVIHFVSAVLEPL